EAGPLSRDARDARLLGSVLSGRSLEAGDGSSLRAGIVHSPFWENLDPEVERACADTLEATGWQVEELALDGAEHAMGATVLRLSIEALPNITREELAEAPPLARGVTKYQMLLPGRHLMQADRIRALLRGELVRAFESC